MTRPLVTALAGVTIACPDPATLAGLLAGKGGWERLCEFAIDDGMARLWGIAPGSAGAAAIVMRSPKASRGMIRIVTGPERIPPAGRMGTRWTGVEIVAMKNLDGLCKVIGADPAFRLIKGVKDADFTDVGANIHQFFFGRPPGGTHVMYTMAVTQPKDYEFPTAASDVGHIFDVHLVSRDFDASRAFYRGILGMIPMLEDSFDRGLWHDTWVLPVGKKVRLDIIKGDAPGFGLGGIELQGYDLDLIDPTPTVSDRFDGGACMATFSTRDIDAAHKAVQSAKGVEVLSSPTAVAAYQNGRAFAFRGPSGERVEIVERLWA